MADMIQMLDGMTLGCGPSIFPPSRYSARLQGFGAAGDATPTPPVQPSFWEQHKTQLQVAALIGLSVWWMKIRKDRRDRKKGNRYLRSQAMKKSKRGPPGRTTSGSYRIVEH